LNHGGGDGTPPGKEEEMKKVKVGDTVIYEGMSWIVSAIAKGGTLRLNPPGLPGLLAAIYRHESMLDR
jgi:hypothetical protein